MNLTPGVSINRGDPVTRQTIFNLIANALGGTVQASDLDPSVHTIASQSEAPAAAPGKLWWDMTDQLMKVYVDAVDNTGCSLWCAFGPDRFDIPVLASEPIPFGAAVKLRGPGRYVERPLDPITLNTLGQGYREWENARVIGFNNTGTKANAETTASGAWMACAVEGFVWCWYPVNKDMGGQWLASLGDYTMDNLLSGTAAEFSGLSGISDIRGGLQPSQVSEIQALNDAILVPSTYRVSAIHANNNYHRRPFSGARLMKHTTG